MGILDGLINPDDQKYALLGALGAGLLGATTGRNPAQSIARGVGGGITGLYGGIQAAQGQQNKLLENQRLQQLIDSQIAAGNRQSQMDQWSQMKDLYQMRRDQGTDHRAEQKAVAEQAQSARDAEKSTREEEARLAAGHLMSNEKWLEDKYPDGTTPKDNLMQMIYDRDTTLAEKLQDRITPKPTDDIREYEYAKREGYKGTLYDFITKKKKAGASSTTVTVNTGGKEFWKGVGEGAAKNFDDQRRGAQSAVQSIETINTAKGLLDSGMITGTAANWRLAFGNALATAGLADPMKNGVANTNAYVANVGRQVGEIIKAFGSGTGLSDADREYAQKIAGGQIEATAESLGKILDINDRAARNVIRRYNAQASKLQNSAMAEQIPVDFMVAEPPLYQRGQGTQSSATGAPQGGRRMTFNPATGRIE